MSNRNSFRKIIKYYCFKELLLTLYIAIFYKEYFDRIVHFGFSIKGTIFIGLLLVCIVSIFMASYIHNNVIRILYASLFFISTVTFIVYESITNSFLTYNSFIILIASRGFAGEAFQQYFSSVIFQASSGLVILIGVSLKPKSTQLLFSRYFVLFPIFVLILLTTLIFIRGGSNSAKGFPPLYNLLAYSLLDKYEDLSGIETERKNVQIRRDSVSVDYDIIFIVDESIAPRYLDINSKSGVLTNLKGAFENINIYNYGYAASISGCSASSNLSLRFGGKRDNYLVCSSSMPSIWQYAKNAGLRTVYIDGQETGGNLQNFMTEEEVKDIDEFIQLDDVSVLNIDITIAKKLVKYINNDKREFIYINKIGGHFPVNDKYPSEYMLYKPVLPRGNNTNIAHTSSKNFSGSVENWILYRNSYKNTILWNVGNFFDIVLSETKIKDAVIFYTSDHGQYLHEDENLGLGTHCGSDPNMVEGRVPLVIIQNSSIKSLNWEKYFDSNINHSSHYNIFPTLLSLMHYNHDQVVSIYGNPLDDEVNDEMTFNTKYFARLGQHPRWKKIEISQKEHMESFYKTNK